MVISELVAALEAIMAEHGDVLVMHHDDLEDLPVDRVSFAPPGSVDDEEPCVVLHSPPYPAAPEVLPEDVGWKVYPRQKVRSSMSASGDLVMEVEQEDGTWVRAVTDAQSLIAWLERFNKPQA